MAKCQSSADGKQCLALSGCQYRDISSVTNDIHSSGVNVSSVIFSEHTFCTKLCEEPLKMQRKLIEVH